MRNFSDVQQANRDHLLAKRRQKKANHKARMATAANRALEAGMTLGVYLAQQYRECRGGLPKGRIYHSTSSASSNTEYGQRRERSILEILRGL